MTQAKETKPANVVQALAAVMAELPAIGKGKKADPKQGGYAYRGIDQITTAVQPLLAKYGIVFVPRVVDHEIREITVNDKPWTDTVALVAYDVYGPGGAEDKITVGPILSIGRDNSDKGGNKCLTQAFKYALTQTLCISDERDDADHGSPEADSVSPEESAKQKAWGEIRASMERGVSKENVEKIAAGLEADVQTLKGAQAIAKAVATFEKTGVLPKAPDRPLEAVK